jgi:hypothetical protein
MRTAQSRLNTTEANQPVMIAIIDVARPQSGPWSRAALVTSCSKPDL